MLSPEFFRASICVLRYNRLFAVLLLTLSVLLCGCDPQAAALKIFTQQGLTVLEPARDYIKLGGLFVIPKSGTPTYLDPFDSLAPTDGAASTFNATLLQQSTDNSSALDAAVGTLGSLVAIPAGLKFSHNTQVQLGQIDSSGTRFTSQQVAAMIKMPATREAIHGQLDQGNGNRLFIVQEIYMGKSLSVKSSSNTGLAAAVEGAASIPTCSSPSASGAKGGTGANGSTGSSGTTGAKAGTGTSGSTGNNNAKASGSTGSTGGTGNNAKAPGANGASSVGISVGACWSNTTTLSFKSDKDIPFAVRLNEVAVLAKGPTGPLQIKVTGFKLPNTHLGPADVSATALPSADNPILTALNHQLHK